MSPTPSRTPRRRPGHRSPRHLVTTAGLLLALVSIVVTSCSKDASTRTTADDGPTTTAAPVTAVPDSIPAGTTLRVGDQLDYLKTVLSLAGQDKDFGYTVEYSAFIGGPPMLQAFQADALDTGFVGSTPLIFAQAGGQDITAVAGWASERGTYGLVAGPGQDDIGSWADLAGKRVAYQKGTAGEAALLQALDAAGLKLSPKGEAMVKQSFTPDQSKKELDKGVQGDHPWIWGQADSAGEGLAGAVMKRGAARSLGCVQLRGFCRFCHWILDSIGIAKGIRHQKCRRSNSILR